MAKVKFEDPLEEIDPIMNEAFSSDVSLDSETIEGLADTLGEEDEGALSMEEYSDVPQQNLFSDDDSLEDVKGQDELVDDIQFPNLTKNVSDQKVGNDVFSNIPVSVSVELGRSRVSLKEVFELTEGSIIELERLVGEPLDLVVNGQIIAQGEVVAIDNNYGFRVTNIISNTQN